MLKKCGLEKRLSKISKHEAASQKLLEKQEKDLEKAIEENQKIIERIVIEETPQESKLKGEIEKLTNKLNQLRFDLEKVNKTL